jgi:hypothetical protein
MVQLQPGLSITYSLKANLIYLVRGLPREPMAFVMVHQNVLDHFVFLEIKMPICWVVEVESNHLEFRSPTSRRVWYQFPGAGSISEK